MILVIADDMTGALEVGAVFANAGFRALVSTRPDSELTADVVVLDTETRHISSSAAFDRTVAAIQSLAIIPDLVYKKTDSTLRGNIRSELHALSSVFPHWRIGYAPAYPRQGRTVTNGIVHVDGVPVSETSFARDSLNPVTTSSVRALIGPELPCTIFDGITDADVRSAAETILGDKEMRIAAGPSALAGVLAARLTQVSATSNLPRVNTCLVMNGSRTELSGCQIGHAERLGCLARNGAAAWTLADSEIAAETDAAAVAGLRAESLIGLLRERPRDAVFLIGGDTAHAFVCTLGNPPLIPITEVLPGVPITRISNSTLGDFLLITKAGGFGEVDVLCRVRQILERNGG